MRVAVSEVGRSGSAKTETSVDKGLGKGNVDATNLDCVKYADDSLTKADCSRFEDSIPGACGSDRPACVRL